MIIKPRHHYYNKSFSTLKLRAFSLTITIWFCYPRHRPHGLLSVFGIFDGTSPWNHHRLRLHTNSESRPHCSIADSTALHVALHHATNVRLQIGAVCGHCITSKLVITTAEIGLLEFGRVVKVHDQLDTSQRGGFKWQEHEWRIGSDWKSDDGNIL